MHVLACVPTHSSMHANQVNPCAMSRHYNKQTHLLIDSTFTSSREAESYSMGNTSSREAES